MISASSIYLTNFPRGLSDHLPSLEDVSQFVDSDCNVLLSRVRLVSRRLGAVDLGAEDLGAEDLGAEDLVAAKDSVPRDDDDVFESHVDQKLMLLTKSQQYTTIRRHGDFKTLARHLFFRALRSDASGLSILQMVSRGLENEAIAILRRKSKVKRMLFPYLDELDTVGLPSSLVIPWTGIDSYVTIELAARKRVN